MKTINCARCNKEIEYRPHRKYCIPCRKAVDDDNARKYCEKHCKK
jgi:hypothetical protein